MRSEINQVEGWTSYTSEGPGTSPTIRLHFSEKIELLSPGDPQDKVSLVDSTEKTFVYLTLKRVQEEGLGQTFSDKHGRLIVAYSSSAGLSIRRQGVTRQFHIATDDSLKFVVDVLEHISFQ